MLRIDTSNGTYYLFDTENMVAKRVPGPGRRDYWLDDEVFPYIEPIRVYNPDTSAEWDSVDSITQVEVGDAMIIDTPGARSPWRLTSLVTNITQTDEEFYH